MGVGALALLVAMGSTGRAPGAWQDASARLVHGHVEDVNGQPLAGVMLSLKKTDSLAVTDARGDFALPVPVSAAPPFEIGATLPGYAPTSVTLPSATDLSTAMVLGPVHPVYRAVTTAPTFGSTATPEIVMPPLDGRMVIRPLDVVRTPGTEADLMRELGTLPGVVAVDAGDGLFVRGGDVSETQVLLDGVVVSHPYRDETPTGGFRGAVDPFLTRDASFTTGGFGSPYGNVLSAVVDLSGQDRPHTSQLTTTAGLAGVSFSEGEPIGANAGLRLAANRATPAILFGVNPSSATFDEFPGGWDLSGAFYESSATLGDFKVFALSQADHVGVQIRQDAFTGFLHSSTSQTLLMGTWQRAFAGGWHATAAFGHDAFGSTEDAGVLRLDNRDSHRSGRVEVRGRAFGWAVRLGQTFDADVPRNVGSVPFVGGDFGGVQGTKTFTVQTHSWTGGAYLDAERTAGIVTVEAGVRTDYFSNALTETLDPRLAVLLAVTPNQHLRVAWGEYHEAPASPYLDEVSGQPRLGPAEATQYIIGYEIGTIAGPSFLRLEAYDKVYSDLPLEDPLAHFTTAGYGSAYGVDLFMRRVWPRVTLRGNGSWLEAARRWTPWNQVNTFPVPASGTWAPDFDIPYALDVVATVTVTSHWSIDANWRTTAGRPLTPVIGAVPTSTGYLPVWGAINTERVPPYARLDASISRRTSIGSHSAVFFLSGGNLLDRHNFYQYSYSPDYTVRTPVPTGSPRTVYVGLTFTR
jgi:vitamin B12 transporter